jgi:hypothetical protein
MHPCTTWIQGADLFLQVELVFLDSCILCTPAVYINYSGPWRKLQLITRKLINWNVLPPSTPVFPICLFDRAILACRWICMENHFCVLGDSLSTCCTPARKQRSTISDARFDLPAPRRFRDYIVKMSVRCIGKKQPVATCYKLCWYNFNQWPRLPLQCHQTKEGTKVTLQ